MTKQRRLLEMVINNDSPEVEPDHQIRIGTRTRPNAPRLQIMIELITPETQQAAREGS